MVIYLIIVMRKIGFRCCRKKKKKKLNRKPNANQMRFYNFVEVYLNCTFLKRQRLKQASLFRLITNKPQNENFYRTKMDTYRFPQNKIAT